MLLDSNWLHFPLQVKPEMGDCCVGKCFKYLLLTNILKRTVLDVHREKEKLFSTTTHLQKKLKDPQAALKPGRYVFVPTSRTSVSKLTQPSL